MVLWTEKTCGCTLMLARRSAGPILHQRGNRAIVKRPEEQVKGPLLHQVVHYPAEVCRPGRRPVRPQQDNRKTDQPPAQVVHGQDSACDVVNGWSERDLVTIFRRYGEERYAKQIARAIVRRRREQPFERTGELVDTIRAAIPAPARFGDGHPAKRVFQALRIAVNDELDSLATALPAALEMLRPGGRLAVISFHSLEDRIVKRFLRERERGCTCPPDFPVCVCGHEPELRALQRRPIRPGHAELAANPRSASARLRAAIKTGPEEA